MDECYERMAVSMVCFGRKHWITVILHGTHISGMLIHLPLCFYVASKLLLLVKVKTDVKLRMGKKVVAFVV